jgi:uncharacterized protein (DUF1697 family)
MQKYIAFLRGINVGQIRIKMADLKLAFAQMGAKGVSTYLQSGNVVFEADGLLTDLKPLLEQGLTQTFDYEAFVLLYPFSALAPMATGYPFSRDEAHHAYLVFVENEPTLSELAALFPTLGEEAERLAAGQGVIYWKVPIGQSTDTPFANLLAKTKYKSTTTVRNLNTLEKMLVG